MPHRLRPHDLVLCLEVDALLLPLPDGGPINLVATSPFLRAPRFSFPMYFPAWVSWRPSFDLGTLRRGEISLRLPTVLFRGWFSSLAPLALHFFCWPKGGSTAGGRRLVRIRFAFVRSLPTTLSHFLEKDSRSVAFLHQVLRPPSSGFLLALSPTVRFSMPPLSLEGKPSSSKDSRLSGNVSGAQSKFLLRSLFVTEAF